MANDPLAHIVMTSRAYLNDEDKPSALDVYKLRLSLLVQQLTVNEAKALADVITTYAIHLRKGH